MTIYPNRPAPTRSRPSLVKVRGEQLRNYAEPCGVCRLGHGTFDPVVVHGAMTYAVISASLYRRAHAALRRAKEWRYFAREIGACRVPIRFRGAARRLPGHSQGVAVGPVTPRLVPLPVGAGRLLSRSVRVSPYQYETFHDVS